MFRYIIFPIVPDVIFIFVFSFVNSIDAPPVDVNVFVLGLGAPYSTGFLNCLSDTRLFELVVHIMFFAFLLSRIVDASIIDCVDVAQAL